MNSEKLKMLEKYINLGISPILLEDVPTSIFKNAIILEGDCDISQLNGHYENIDFVPPEWYKNIMERSKNRFSLLVINELNKIPKEEQLKFVELFKYKKISTFDLPENCIVIATCSNLEERPIAEEVYSFLVHI